MRHNQPFHYTLEEADQFQTKITFQFEGWDILGFADMAKTGEWVANIKIGTNTGESKIRYKIREELLLQQLAIYAHGLEVHEARLLFFDHTCHFRAVRVGDADLQHWMKYVGNVIDKFEDCVFNGNWEQSHDFGALIRTDFLTFNNLKNEQNNLVFRHRNHGLTNQLESTVRPMAQDGIFGLFPGSWG